LLVPSQQLLRIHKVGRGPWWFSHDSPLRFDLAAPLGTCYLAEQDLGAFVEALQNAGALIPRAEIDARSISTLSVPTAVTLADCTNPRARAFGITAEIHSSVDRAMTRAWAAAFERHGFGGVRYLVRHDPSQSFVAIALFSDAGEASWAITFTDPIDDDLIQRAENTFGIRVV
jgi:hypothetical protein